MPKPFTKIAVVGSGTLGAQIAMMAVNAGYDVTVFDQQTGAFDEMIEKLQLDLAAKQIQPFIPFDQFDHRINVGLSQVRVRVDADLTDNIAATVRLLNERVWGEEGQAGDETDIDLDLAYVAVKEFLYSPLSLIVGRREIKCPPTHLPDN